MDGSSRTTTTAVQALVAATLLPAGLATAQEIIELPAEDRNLAVELVDLYRVGAMTGEDWEQFGNVRRVGFDAEGKLYIFDNQADRIHVVGPDGEYVRTLGQSGEGPGEFRRPDGLAVMRDGRVVITDRGHRAYHIFGPDGEFERMVGFVPEAGDMRITDIYPDPGGEAIFTAVGAQILSASFGSTGARTTPHTSRPVERIILSGEVATKDTVAEGWLPSGGDNTSIPVDGRTNYPDPAPPGLRAGHSAGRAPRWKRGFLRLVGLCDQDCATRGGSRADPDPATAPDSRHKQGYGRRERDAGSGSSKREVTGVALQSMA